VRESLSLYVHIPFCRSKCHYCSFNSYSGLDWLVPQYLQALTKEMRSCARQEPVNTIYLGGGTPTLLDSGQLGAVLQACDHSFAVSFDAEISIEANPGDINQPFLEEMRALGINRLSLGAQSWDDAVLKKLGRRHSAAEAVAAYHLARAAFDNVNIDLLYAVPGQTLEQWRQALERALSLEADHLSLYPLSVEEGTALSAEIASGRMVKPDPDLAAEMFLMAEEALADYDHYEISNWARPTKRCRHNLTYWRNLPYLGFGAGAHSFIEGRRLYNVLSPSQYVRKLDESDSAVEGQEDIDEALEMAETVILGLRLGDGVSRAAFAGRFGKDVDTVYGDEVCELVELGLLLDDGGAIRLTQRGRLLGNQVFLRFLP
jgi:oxygen-independent coproporphyrinogen-3 oxidase